MTRAGTIFRSDRRLVECERGTPLRILLLSMPWHALDRPALGLSLLKARAEQDGHECEIRYLGFDLVDSIGLEDYLWVHGELPYTAFAGDWLFTPLLYGERSGLDDAYVEEVLVEQWQRSRDDVARLRRIRARLWPFLEHCDLTIADDYDIIGFTSTFEQNIASLALAQRLASRRRHPVIVFGGANWEGEMGQALHRRFAFVDIVVSGEADDTFPRLLRSLAAGEELADIHGLVVREAGGATRATGRPAVVHDLDHLPVPRYDDFLEQLEQSSGARGVLPTLLLETSRGCWWGAKHHCTFCGLNGGTMQFRSKSPERVVAEIDGLLVHQPGSLAVVDNILDMRYFTTLLPELARRGGLVELFYEVKANLARHQICLLALAGVRHVQPGIESLSDSILALMRKGTTALQNIQFLKWCVEYGVVPEWNFLYGFPGEDPAEYAVMARLIDSLAHLTPPSGYGPVRLDRFSPYHENPEGLGMTDVRPARPCRYLYDADPAELMQIAYYFDYSYADGRDLAYVAPALDRIKAWQRAGRQGSLLLQADSAGAGLVIDSRRGSPEGLSLESWQLRLLHTLDSITTAAVLRRQAEEDGVSAADLAGFLAACEARQLVVRSGDRWLGLAVHNPPRWADDHPAPRLLSVLRD